jgi:hypothetical protein
MKTNELKVTDLMVGDWCYIKDYPMSAQPMQVKKEHFVRSLVEFEPIPLTPEILKKNGFGGNKPKVKLILEDTRKLLYNIYEKELTIYWNSQVVFRSPCAYAHQLQHALRLCGIDKEIEL